MPRSIATAISNGPVSTATWSATSKASAAATRRRCGRSSEPSSRRDLAASRSPVTLSSSSRSSVATPRHGSCGAVTAPP
ncbi:MAG: hypothetical protein ACRDTG_10780 [Pseudonocardiaceae bacterium]